MGSIGWPEIVIIAAVILVLFGATKIPEFFEGLGKGVKRFKEEVGEAEDGNSDTDNKDDGQAPPPPEASGEEDARG